MYQKRSNDAMNELLLNHHHVRLRQTRPGATGTSQWAIEQSGKSPNRRNEIDLAIQAPWGLPFLKSDFEIES